MRRSKFCPKCGKDTQELHAGLCSDCFLAKTGMTDKIPVKISVGNCKMCGRMFAGDGRFDDVESAVEGVLHKILKQKEIADASYRIVGSNVHVTVDLKVDGLEKEVNIDVPLVQKYIICNMCSLQKASYFNSTIQVRASTKELERKIVAEIKDEILRMNRKDKYSFVSGEAALKEGTDLYIGSKSVANKVVRMIQERYGAEVKKSRKLYGLIEGKKSYRDTVLVSVKK